jgi:glycine oxidase
MSQPRCLIVGGGIVGLSAAWELSRRGFLCTVVDAGSIGRGASWAGAGVLPPARLDTAHDPIDQLRGLSHQLHPSWAAELRAESGIDPQLDRCGGVYLARTPGETAALMGQAAYWAEYGIEAHRLEADALRMRLPALAPEGTGSNIRVAYWLPDELRMHPPEYLRALTTALRRRQVELVEASEITELEIIDDEVRGARAAGGARWTAEHVLLCCGAWASRFADARGAIRDAYPVRGQVVLYRDRPDRLPCIVNEGNRYLVPRRDGHIYVGSSEEEVGWQLGTTPEIIGRLRQWAESLVPALREAVVVRTFSGLRPGSFDTFPFLGRSPKYRNLYLATGHFRSGLHLACGTAQLLGELIGGEATSISLAPFRAGRGTAP